MTTSPTSPTLPPDPELAARYAAGLTDARETMLVEQAMDTSAAWRALVGAQADQPRLEENLAFISVELDAPKRGWIERLMTPHPFRTMETQLTLSGPPGAGKPACYVTCTDPHYSKLEYAHARARDLGWAMAELAAGHDAMVTSPEALADLLEAE